MRFRYVTNIHTYLRAVELLLGCAPNMWEISMLSWVKLDEAEALTS